MKTKKNPGIFRKLGLCESFYTEKKRSVIMQLVKKLWTFMLFLLRWIDPPQ